VIADETAWPSKASCSEEETYEEFQASLAALGSNQARPESARLWTICLTCARVVVEDCDCGGAGEEEYVNVIEVLS